jgi:hypothetical protein
MADVLPALSIGAVARTAAAKFSSRSGSAWTSSTSIASSALTEPDTCGLQRREEPTALRKRSGIIARALARLSLLGSSCGAAIDQASIRLACGVVTSLPSDLLSVISNLSTLSAAAAFSATCRACRDAYIESGLQHRHLLLHSLHLALPARSLRVVPFGSPAGGRVLEDAVAQEWEARRQPVATMHTELLDQPYLRQRLAAQHATDWRRGRQALDALWASLGRCPSPGCRVQKYLRHLENMPAACHLVVHLLVGISLLPPKLELCFAPTRPAGGSTADHRSFRFSVPCQAALRWMFSFHDCTACGSSERECAAAACSFDPGRLEALLHWIAVDATPEQSRARLRLAMAEARQISVRNVEMLLRTQLGQGEKEGGVGESPTRQMGALAQLVYLGCCDPEHNLVYWA